MVRIVTEVEIHATRVRELTGEGGKEDGEETRILIERSEGLDRYEER